VAEERFFIDGETATSLLTKLQPLTDVRANAVMETEYLGKWIQANGIVVDVSKYTWGVTVSLDLGNLLMAFLEFAPDATKPLELSKGDLVAVQGKIRGRTLIGALDLADCDLIRAVPREEAEALADKQFEERPLPRPGVDEKPPLSDAALRAWLAAFKIAYPNGTQTLAEKSAAGAFPNHSISRSRIRELFPNSPRGRPKQNKGLHNPPESDGE
jgi:hypothetical protein